MRQAFVALSFLVLIALVASCGGSDKPKFEPTPAFPPDENWRVEYTRTGGIAGINQTLMMDWRGTLTTQDKRTLRSGQGTVAPSDVSMVKGLLRGMNLPNLKSDQGLPAPDAILLSIKVIAGDKSYGATFNKTPDDPGSAGLFRRLDALYGDFKP